MFINGYTGQTVLLGTGICLFIYLIGSLQQEYACTWPCAWLFSIKTYLYSCLRLVVKTQSLPMCFYIIGLVTNFILLSELFVIIYMATKS